MRRDELVRPAVAPKKVRRRHVGGALIQEKSGGRIASPRRFPARLSIVFVEAFRKALRRGMRTGVPRNVRGRTRYGLDKESCWSYASFRMGAVVVKGKRLRNEDTGRSIATICGRQVGASESNER